MFSSALGPSGYKYVETCTINPANVQGNEQEDRTVFVNVDGSYYQFAEKIDGQIQSRNKHDYGRSYGFSMKLSVLVKSLENINPQAATQVKSLNDGKIFSFSVIINESDQEKNRIDALLKKLYQEQISPITPIDEFIAEIANAVTNKRNPVYSKRLLDISVREVSHKALWDCNFCEKLKQSIAKLIPSQTNTSVEQVKSTDYPKFKVPYGCKLFKVQIGESEMFFDLGQHATTPVMVYNTGQTPSSGLGLTSPTPTPTPSSGLGSASSIAQVQVKEYTLDNGVVICDRVNGIAKVVFSQLWTDKYKRPSYLVSINGKMLTRPTISTPSENARVIFCGSIKFTFAQKNEFIEITEVDETSQPVMYIDPRNAVNGIAYDAYSYIPTAITEEEARKKLEKMNTDYPDFKSDITVYNRHGVAVFGYDSKKQDYALCWANPHEEKVKIMECFECGRLRDGGTSFAKSTDQTVNFRYNITNGMSYLNAEIATKIS